MKKYFTTFGVALALGVVWLIVGKCLSQKSEVFLLWFFITIPTALIARSQTDLPTVNFAKKLLISVGLATLVLTPLFSLQVMNNNTYGLNPIYAGLVIAHDWSPVTGAAYFLWAIFSSKLRTKNLIENKSQSKKIV